MRARLAGLVAIIEMIGAGIVEIDRALDEAHAERPGVEIQIARGGPGDRGDMVNAVMGHGRCPFSAVAG